MAETTDWGNITSSQQRSMLKDWPKRSVAVLFVHGIMQGSPGYTDPLYKRVAKVLKTGSATRDVERTDLLGRKSTVKVTRRHLEWLRWREVYWAGVTRTNQLAYSGAADALHPRPGWRNWETTRNMVLTGLGDAAAYQRVTEDSNQTYNDIQFQMQAGVDGLLDRDYPLRPLIIVAHSTGSQIASTFIHDTLQDLKHGKFRSKVRLSDNPERAAKEKRFLTLETLSGIITLGSNLPMFSFALGRDAILPINFPQPYDSELEECQNWINYFYKADVLGFPLRPISETYRSRVTADVALNKRWRLPGPIPPLKLHGRYWKDRRVVNGVGHMILKLMTAGEYVAPSLDGANTQRIGLAPGAEGWS